MRVRSLVGKSLRSRKWQPAPVFLPGKSLGQKSQAVPQGCKESDTTEQPPPHTELYYDLLSLRN